MPAHELPASLDGWTEATPDAPTIIMSEQGDYMYLLISMGDCSPVDSEIYVRTVAWSGDHPLSIRVQFRERDPHSAPGHPGAHSHRPPQS